MGHFFSAKMLGVNTKYIVIYPLGGISKMDMDISIKPYKEILILLMGPITQIITYFIILRFNCHISLIKYYHYGVLFFNLLPIIPLDGGRLLNIIINYFIPYKLTLKISIFLGYLFTTIILFMNKQLSINMIITYIVLILLIRKEELKLDLLFNKFIMERLLKNYSFNKNSYINKESSMYRYRNNKFKSQNKWLSEKEYLKQKYLT